MGPGWPGRRRPRAQKPWWVAPASRGTAVRRPARSRGTRTRASGTSDRDKSLNVRLTLNLSVRSLRFVRNAGMSVGVAKWRARPPPSRQRSPINTKSSSARLRAARLGTGAGRCQAARSRGRALRCETRRSRQLRHWLRDGSHSSAVELKAGPPCARSCGSRSGRT